MSRSMLFSRKACFLPEANMVHSDVIFWSLFLCKRRPFLSDLRTSLFAPDVHGNSFCQKVQNQAALAYPR